MIKFNPYHLLNPRPWPFTSSASFLAFGLGVVVMVTTYNPLPFLASLGCLAVSSLLWGQDISREGCYEGAHNDQTLRGFKLGIILFILSECFFFLGIFWSYLHLAEAPSVEVGGAWPPMGVAPFDPKGVPFLNTILLVSSGISVTWSHHAIEIGLFKARVASLLITVALGITFSYLQLIEYFFASFTFSCSCYSSVYFLGTGFHGIHVLVGRILLLVCLVRFSKTLIRPNHRVGFECSVWYWHFVDIVWFLLYLVFYWWGV